MLSYCSIEYMTVGKTIFVCYFKGIVVKQYTPVFNLSCFLERTQKQLTKART